MAVGGTAFQWAPLVFFSSSGLVFLSHTIGYFEHPALLVALVAMGISRFDLRYLFVLLFLPPAILLHEAALPIFGAVIAYIFVLDICRSPSAARIVSCLLLFAMLTLISVVALNGTLPENLAQALYEKLQSRADYQLRRDGFDVLIRGLGIHFPIMAAMRHDKIYLIEFFSSLLVALPAVVFLLASSIRMLIQGKNRAILIVAACVASLSPSLLHAVAWDCARWNTLTITTSYLVLLATVLAPGPPPLRQAPDL